MWDKNSQYPFSWGFYPFFVGILSLFRGDFIPFKAFKSPNFGLHKGPKIEKKEKKKF